MNIIETNLKFGALSTRKSTKRAILHHPEASKCTAEDIHRWHLQNGWSGAGYHFLVRKDGHIYRLRGQGFQGLGGLHLSRGGHEKALSRQKERQQQGKTSEFFHNYPSRSHHRTCPAKKNRV